MNKEIEKAMNRKENAFQRFAKWYRKNGYKINRVILFPIWIGEVIYTRIRRRKVNKTVWSEERANEILNYYVPRKSEWDAEAQEFYFVDNGMGWGMSYNLRKIKRKDRFFWKKFSAIWGGEIRKYLIEKFELEGFTKTVGDTYDYWAEITFTKN